MVNRVKILWDNDDHIEFDLIYSDIYIEVILKTLQIKWIMIIIGIGIIIKSSDVFNWSSVHSLYPYIDIIINYFLIILKYPLQ